MRLRFANCILDAATRSLSRDGQAVHVEPKVLDLLVLLAEQRERVVPKNELMDALWPDAVVGEAALSRLVKEARRAVGDDGASQSVIRTFHRRGYRFVAVAATTQSRPDDSRRRTIQHPVAEDEIPESRGETTAISDVPPSLPDSRRVTTLGVLWLFPEPLGWSIVQDRPVRVGRGDTCDRVLPGRDVSRRHAELSRRGGTIVVRDLASRNGTYVDGERVTKAPLTLGNIVRIGEWVGVVAGAPIGEYRSAIDEVAPGFVAGPRMQRKVGGLKKAATSDLPVVIQGETGSGKGTIARALHHWDGAGDPLVVVGCAARPDDFSFEEALRIEMAATETDRVTVFLDGVAELPPSAQGELVRLLDEGRIRLPSGATRRLRVISSADQPLEAAVAQGTFRADLCARLSAVVFAVPPLRERVEEIPPLFLHFLRIHHEGPPPVPHARLVEKLCLYDWPFNVRELEYVARYLLLSKDPNRSFGSSLLPPHIRTFEPESTTDTDSSPLKELRAALRHHSGRLGPASVAAGITRNEALELMSRPEQGSPDEGGEPNAP